MESDSEFLDRMAAVLKTGVRGSFEDFNRLFASALARKGAKAEWRPIETAPKDGTEILLLIQFPDQKPVFVVARYRGGASPWRWVPCEDGAASYSEEYATHWMPLPPPPQQENEQ